MYYAHNGVDHATQSESLAHVAEKNWPIIVAVTAVAVVAMLGIVYFVTKKAPKKVTHKQPSKESADE